ncbi:hypothetical protein K493DRAFT_316714 [Basidiobolus meristosporus CBS 931.73]|uniref:Uncharacterized protein n=1 Tax=Basidiobolus meristosporus CBS 931.73 TaxID=1314790 RepID=A0A1Y1Y2J0_9FUNG|nr:hypothetical protein K493DRAFT_316714 [Basidiobolus meristosporus CBS 931.73]|eukprot:ORX92210.1 hypothetical protein K493DRAFT_316714 [Basidiobolus meristosporus CBS 931.73]
MSKNVSRVVNSSFQALKNLGGSVARTIRPNPSPKSAAIVKTSTKEKAPPSTNVGKYKQASITQLFSKDSSARKTAALSLGKQFGKSTYQLLLAGGKKGVEKVLSLKPVNEKVTQLQGNRNFQNFLLLTNSTCRVVQNLGKSTVYTVKHLGQPRQKLPPAPPTTFRTGNYVRVLQREEGSLWLWVQFTLLALPGSWALYKVTSDETIKSQWRNYILTTKEQFIQKVNH